MSNEFEDLNEPIEDLGMPLTEGMPDPIAEDQAPADVEPEPQELEEPETVEEPENTPEAEPKRGGVAAILARADLFTVLLAISLTAILIAVFCLVVEWGRYSFERNPKVSAVVPVSHYAACLENAADVQPGGHVVG